MPGKYGFNPKNKNTKQYKSWAALSVVIGNKLKAWAARQMELEKSGGVQHIPAKYYADFFQPAKVKELSEFAKTLVDPKGGVISGGIGFIPLLIWAVILVAGFFTVAYIVDRTTVTAKDKEELLAATEKTMKDLNIPPDKAAAIIQSTQTEVSASAGGGFTSAIKWGVGGLILLFALSSLNKSKT